jgi:hypothetical protein
MNITDPTYKKLIKDDINEVRIQASILAKVQDFCKTYAVYQGMDADGNLPPEITITPAAGKTGKASQRELDDALAKARELIDEEPPKSFDKDFWCLLREIEKKLPRHMSISLTINSKK